jgi:hypothetical protein
LRILGNPGLHDIQFGVGPDELRFSVLAQVFLDEWQYTLPQLPDMQLDAAVWVRRAELV